jgi:hypothetical protein
MIMTTPKMISVEGPTIIAKEGSKAGSTRERASLTKKTAVTPKKQPEIDPRPPIIIYPKYQIASISENNLTVKWPTQYPQIAPPIPAKKHPMKKALSFTSHTLIPITFAAKSLSLTAMNARPILVLTMFVAAYVAISKPIIAI